MAVVGTGTTKKGTGKMKKVGDSWDFLGRGESPIPPTTLRIKDASCGKPLDEKN